MPNAAINVDPRREQLIAALRGNDAYTFLTRIGPYLQDVPEDFEALEWAVRTCVAMGFFSHARRILSAAAPPDEVRGSFDALITGRDQRVAWSALRERYEGNLAAFDARTGLGESIDALWRSSASKLELLRSADGCYQVFSRLPAAPGWLPSLGAHDRAADADALRKEWSKRIICPLAVHGIGLGYTACALIEASRDTLVDFSAPVFLIESSPLAWAVVMHLHDWRAAFSEQRVHICAGADALARFERALQEGELAAPAVISGAPHWPGGIEPSRVEAAVASHSSGRQRKQHELYERVCRKTAARDAAWWAERYANAGRTAAPLTVLGVTSRFTTVLQYTMRDLLGAFRANGCKTHLIIERDNSSYFSPARTLEAIDEFDPDLIVNIDHLQAEYATLYPPGIPGLCWIQDQLPNLFNPRAGQSVRPMEYVIGHGFPEAILNFNYPADRFAPCMIPTDPGQMLDPHECEQDLAPYRCDVMYATNASSSPDELHDEYRRRVPEPLRPLIDAVYESLRQVIAQPNFCGDYDFAGLLKRVEAEVGMRISDAGVRADIITGLMRSVADVSLRLRVIRAAARWADETGRRLHLYGRGWDQRPEFARFAKGFVKHGVELGRAFRGATISLHAGCNSALHQRVLDGLSAGGFFLIHEKSSDTAHETSMAVYRYLVEQRPDVPFVMRAEYLPAPHDECYREMLRVRGVDPECGFPFDRSQHTAMMFYGGRGRFPMASGYWPRYREAVFRDAEQFVDRIEYFLAHADERGALAAEMRQVVLENFTYQALAGKTIDQIRRGLSRCRIGDPSRDRQGAVGSVKR